MHPIDLAPTAAAPTVLAVNQPLIESGPARRTAQNTGYAVVGRRLKISRRVAHHHRGRR